MNADLNVILPEILMSVYAIAALLGVAYSGQDRMAGLLVWVTSAVFVVMALWIGMGATGGTQTAFGGMFNDDGFARFAKVTILLSAAAVLLLGRDYMERRGILRFEYPLLVTLSVVGMMVMVSAGDLMALYMCWGHCPRVCCSTARR